MSWNPRRFAAAVNFPGVAMEPEPLLIWLTADAVDRITDALDNGVLAHTTEPTPVGRPITVGLAQPVSTTLGGVSILVRRCGNPWRMLARAAGVPTALHSPVPRGEDLAETLRANMSTESLSDYLAISAFTRGGVGLGEAALFDTGGKGEPVFPQAPPETKRYNALPGFGTMSPALPDAFWGADAAALGELVRAAWTLFNEPEEAEVTATTVAAQRVQTGKSRRNRHRELDVSVIDIRRHTGTRHAPTDRVVEHDHRWPVRGHWRNQPCGPGRHQRRRIWIDEHVAGPDDKPLVIRPRVYRAS